MAFFDTETVLRTYRGRVQGVGCLVAMFADIATLGSSKVSGQHQRQDGRLDAMGVGTSYAK